MGFKQVSGQAIDIKGFEGEPFEGVYLGSKDIDTKIGPQTIYKFRKVGGTIFQVYGFTNLNRMLEMVSEGSLVRMTYQGKKACDTKYGKGQMVHQVLVEVDEDYVHEEPETREEEF
jgi:hypothetical protein